MFKKQNIILIGILTVSFLLRIWRLGYHDFWFDEIASVDYVSVPWYNWNAPLYWIMLHFWTKIFGISEFALRFPSVLCSFLTVMLVFLLGKSLFDRKTALFATLLIGLSPFHLWYAQEARDYSMVLFFGTLSSYLLYWAAKEGDFKKYFFFAIVSLIGMYTNYFYIFLIIAQFFYIIYIVRLRRVRIYLIFLLIAAGFSFYLPRFFSKFWAVSKGFWVFEPNLQSLPIVLLNYFLGYSGTAFLYTILSFLLVVPFSLLFFLVRKDIEKSRDISFCIFLFLIPLSLVFLFSKLFFSVYLNRGLLLFSPYFYLAISSGAMALPKRIRGILSGVLILVICSGVYLYSRDYMYEPLKYHVGTYLKKPIRLIVNFLDNNVGKGDLIAFSNESVVPSLGFYSKGKYQNLYRLFSPGMLDGMWQRPLRESGYTLPVAKVGNLSFDKLWVISSDWARSGELDENSYAVKQSLDTRFTLVSSRELDGLWIFCYEKRLGNYE
jgi:4-amino-4-deoxy-L-arabinose transferase-like glycosyltransferase